MQIPTPSHVTIDNTMLLRIVCVLVGFLNIESKIIYQVNPNNIKKA